MDDIHFTAETNNYLLKVLKSIAAIDTVEMLINKELAENTLYDVSAEYKMLIDTFKNIQVPLCLIDLQG